MVLFLQIGLYKFKKRVYFCCLGKICYFKEKTMLKKLLLSVMFLSSTLLFAYDDESKKSEFDISNELSNESGQVGSL